MGIPFLLGYKISCDSGVVAKAIPHHFLTQTALMPTKIVEILSLCSDSFLALKLKLLNILKQKKLKTTPNILSASISVQS